MTICRTLLTAVALIAAPLTLNDSLRAQLPLGHVVTSNFAWPQYYPGQGGLFFIDPTTGTVTPVSNLPCELTGACPNPSTPWSGPDYVLNLPETGQLLTNGPNWIGQSVDAYLLTLNGAAVTAVERYPLATYTTSSGLANPASGLLPDGRVLLAIDPTSMGAPGPLAGALLGILDPALPPNDPTAVTPVAVQPIPAGIANGLAIDADRDVAYVVMGNGTQDIWSVPIPGGGTPTLVASLPGGINCLAIEPDGQLLVGGSDAGLGRMWRIDPISGSSSMFPQSFGTPDRINALRIDPVSGDLFLAMPNNNISRLSPRTFAGTVSIVASNPGSGWGRVSGIDMAASLATYGGATGTGPLAEWQIAPNPGGAPTVGNQSFSLTSATAPSSPVSVWAIGLQPLDVMLPSLSSITLQVAPVTTAATFNGTPAQPSTLTFPIPSDPQLQGLELFFQCAHFHVSGVSASGGLRLTIE